MSKPTATGAIMTSLVVPTQKARLATASTPEAVEAFRSDLARLLRGPARREFSARQRAKLMALYDDAQVKLGALS